MTLSISQIYETAAFRLLSQGMKDREAIAIVYTLSAKKQPFENFERWAKDELLEQARLDSDEVRPHQQKTETNETLPPGDYTIAADRVRYGLMRDPPDSPWSTLSDLVGQPVTVKLEKPYVQQAQPTEPAPAPPVIKLINDLRRASESSYAGDYADLLEEASKALATLFSAKPPGEWPRPVSPSHLEYPGKFKLRDRVRKTKGSSWQGRVVGFYSTLLTPIGYAVESEREPGSVQIYPETALEAVNDRPPRPRT